MRGRRSTPTALKILRGNPGRRPLNIDEPQPDELSDMCPAELEHDPVARAEWDRAIVPAIASGHITAADRALAISHCVLWSTWRSQSAEVAALPRVIVEVGEHKYLRAHPVLATATATLALLIRLDSELGFSPVSRDRVRVKKKSHRTTVDRSRARFFGDTGG